MSLRNLFLSLHQSALLCAIFRTLDRIIAFINKNVAVLGLLIGVLIIAVNVFLRTLSSWYPGVGSITWGEEVARYCFIWSALFGAAYGFRKGVHISVMIVVEKFPIMIAKVCILFSYGLCTIYFGFMCYAGVDVCSLNYALGVNSEAFHNVPLWYFLLCLPIAFLGATYRVMEKFYEVLWMDKTAVTKSLQDEFIHDSVVKE